MRYRTGTNLPTLFRRRRLDNNPYPGDTFDWSDVEAYNERDYGIRAYYRACKTSIVQFGDHGGIILLLIHFTYTFSKLIKMKRVAWHNTNGF